MAIGGARLTAMIPARLGSQRLARKNLALLGGKPLLAHAIEAAKASGVFDRIAVNSESEAFAPVAAQCGAEFYRRPEPLGASEAKSDDVVYDFARHDDGDVIAWVNPIAPLQPPEEIREVLGHFVRERLDSLITVREEQVHCNFRGQPLNYRVDEKFARTQDLEPVQRFVYSLMVWRRETFLRAYERDGQALLCGRVGFYPVSRLSSLIVKTEEDLRLCQAILAGRARTGEPLAYASTARGSAA